MTNVTPSFLQDRDVLFIVPESQGIEATDYLTSGTVVEVNTKNKTVLISFMYHGYKSTVEQIPFSHVLCVLDPDNGTSLQLERYFVVGHDLREQPPFGTHPLQPPSVN